MQTECRTSADGLITARNSLRIRQRDCEPVTVVEFQSAAPLPDPDGACRIYGLNRSGPAAVIATPLQRLGVSLDGSAVVFEVSSDLALPVVTPAPEQEGIWFVRADGSGLRKLGPASRDPVYRLTGVPPRGGVYILAYFAFSPDGRLVVYTDLGPGPSGEEAVQVVTLDVVTGHRTQLTHLPAVAVAKGRFAIFPPFFVDPDTVLFQTVTAPDSLHPEGAIVAFTVGVDGARLRAVPEPVPLPGSRVVPTFQLSGTGTGAVTLELGTLTREPPGVSTPVPYPVKEVFFLSARNLVQLTNFGRWDTFAQLLSVDGRRVFFTASADPLGRNPAADCQLFSIDTLGGHLHQLTRFTQSEPGHSGCSYSVPPGCAMGWALQDPRTRTIVFDSSCDPFGTNPAANQIFAIRPDGSGLRQLTAARGFVEEPDGAVSTEQVGDPVISGGFAAPGRRR